MKGYDVIGTYMLLHSLKVFPKCFIFAFVAIYYFCPLSLPQYLLFCWMLVVISFLYSLCYVRVWDVMVKEGHVLWLYARQLVLRRGEGEELRG